MASVTSSIPPTTTSTSTSTSTSTTKSTPTMTSTPRDFLASTTLLDVMQTVKPGPSHRVISVHEDDPVYSALRLMDTHNISSVCVTRHGTHQGVAPEGVPVNAEHPIIGMMQLYDVLVPLILHTVWTEVHHYHRELENRKMAEDPKDREKLEQVIQVAIEKDVFQKPVRACVGFSDETSQLYMMACNTKLSDVLSTFGTSGIHRALLIHNHEDRHYEFQQLRPEIISQIDLIAYIYQQHQRLGSIMSESLTSLGLVDSKKKMITVTETVTAWDGFMALNDDSLFPLRDHLNAVPIVASSPHKVTVTDQDADTDGVTLPAGRLLGSLSVSDIRGLTSTNVHTLMLPVLDYLKLHYPTRQSSIFQITASPTTTFLQLFQLILDNLVHRVWIVDSQNKPIGVVTLSDIIDVFQKRVAGVEPK